MASKKWKILIHSMTFNRDFGMCYILARILERMGCECLIVNNTNVLSLPVRLWNPDAVFFVTPTKISKLIKTYADARHFIFSAEGSVGYKVSEAKLAGDPGTMGRMSRVYLWGGEARRYLSDIYMQTKGADKEKFESTFKVAGNLRGDIIKFSATRKKSEKIRIGLVGSFWLINSIIPGFSLFRHLFETRTNPRILEECSTQVKYLKVLFEIISRLDKDKYEISFRPYPLEEKGSYRNQAFFKENNIKLDSSIDISTWISEQDIVIGNGITTTIALFAIARKPFINLTLLCGSSLKIYENLLPAPLLAATAKNSPADFDTLFDMISNYEKHSFYDEDTLVFLHEIYALQNSGSAILKTAADIVSALEGDGKAALRKSKLPTGVIKLMDSLNLKYRKFRNRDIIKNDYSFFIYDECIGKVREEFDPVFENIAASEEGHKMMAEHK